MQVTHKEIVMMLSVSFFISGLIAAPANGQSDDPLDKYNVVWDSPSVSEKDSMPIGNGEIGINIWAEEDGDVVCSPYIDPVFGEQTIFTNTYKWAARIHNPLVVGSTPTGSSCKPLEYNHL